MNILEIIKKAPEDHVYYSPLGAECYAYINEGNKAFPILISSAGENKCWFALTNDGKIFDGVKGSECVLFPSRDNRDWEAFERELDGVKDNDSRFNPPAYGTDSYKDGVFSDYCEMGDMTAINLDHEYYKKFPFIDFQIYGEKYRIFTLEIKRLAMGNADNKAEIVSIPDRPMMAAVIMSGMLAGGCKDKDAAFVNKALNKALHLADLILDETETKEE